MRVRAAAATGATACAVVLALSGCAAPEYTYVGDSGHALVLRVPRSWVAMDTDEVLEASGLDPATVTGWAAFYDGAADPDPAHAQLESTKEPMLLARRVDVPDEQRDTLSTAQLRSGLLPATADQLDAATERGTFKMITDEAIDDERGAGAHVVYRYKTLSGTEYVEQIALTDPDHTAVSLVRAHCDEACYRERADEISAAVTSLTLKNT